MGGKLCLDHCLLAMVSSVTEDEVREQFVKLDAEVDSNVAKRCE